MEHAPVCLTESIAGLALRPGASCLDGTLGGGGHALALLEATGPDGRLLGLDADATAIARVAQRLAPFGARARLVQANFREMAAVAADEGFGAFQAVLLDLGVSSFQLAEAERGFSFSNEGPLDMRMDQRLSLTAEEIVNTWPAEDLADTIFRYGEEPLSRRYARAIIQARPLRTTAALAALIARVAPGRHRIHPATRTFQALRIAVNDELGAIEAALPQMVGLLAPNGRMAVIAFHSLEDRIAKFFLQREARDCICPSNLPACRCGHQAQLRIITRKPIQPSEAEIAANPRSRSARLRIAERL